jgi:glycosyltransferase involved in cell wall biosynthesis
MTGGLAAGSIPVSVVVMTRDEAPNIGPCLAALAGFTDIVVVDSASRDGTAEIARGSGARVVEFHWDGRYPKKKEWCRRHLDLAHRWMLYVDADEIVAPALAAEIAALMQAGPDRAGYVVESRYVFAGRALRFGLRNAKLALIDRARARFPGCDDLEAPGGWEVEGHYQPVLDGPAGRLRAAMLHDDRKPLSAWLARHERYASWEAHLRATGAKPALEAHEPALRRLLKRLARTVPAQPLAAFVHCYVLRLGFLDGAAGFHFAVSRAVYYWLIAVAARRAAAKAEGGIEAGGMPAGGPGQGLQPGQPGAGPTRPAEFVAADGGLLAAAEGGMAVRQSAALEPADGEGRPHGRSRPAGAT